MLLTNCETCDSFFGRLPQRTCVIRLPLMHLLTTMISSTNWVLNAPTNRCVENRRIDALKLLSNWLTDTTAGLWREDIIQMPGSWQSAFFYFTHRKLTVFTFFSMDL